MSSKVSLNNWSFFGYSFNEELVWISFPISYSHRDVDIVLTKFIIKLIDEAFEYVHLDGLEWFYYKLNWHQPGSCYMGDVFVYNCNARYTYTDPHIHLFNFMRQNKLYRDA